MKIIKTRLSLSFLLNSDSISVFIVFILFLILCTPTRAYALGLCIVALHQIRKRQHVCVTERGNNNTQMRFLG